MQDILNKDTDLISSLIRRIEALETTVSKLKSERKKKPSKKDIEDQLNSHASGLTPLANFKDFIGVIGHTDCIDDDQLVDKCTDAPELMRQLISAALETLERNFQSNNQHYHNYSVPFVVSEHHPNVLFVFHENVWSPLSH
jgi:hypothetical protein